MVKQQFFVMMVVFGKVRIPTIFLRVFALLV